MLTPRALESAYLRILICCWVCDAFQPSYDAYWVMDAAGLWGSADKMDAVRWGTGEGNMGARTSQQVINLGKCWGPKQDEADIVIRVQGDPCQTFPLQW